MTTTDRHHLHRPGHHRQSRRPPGDRIDDIPAGAQAYAALSGGSLGEAFGSPREYARVRPASPARPDPARALVAGIAAVVGGTALLAGSVRLVGSFDATALGLLVLGLLVLVGAAAVAPLRALRDPVSAGARPARSTAVLLGLAGCVVIGGAGIVGALL